MLVSQWLSFPTDVVVEDLLLENQVLILVLASTLPTRCCPSCSQPSTRVHSRYTRRRSDLPCQGRLVRLQIAVRRFRCVEPTCRRVTKASQFPGLAAAYARRTNRQAEALCEVALALGGRAGVPLAKKLALPTSRHTLLRLLRRTPAPAATTPRQIGIDDFAWKKGEHYGTILVDLARHCPVEPAFRSVCRKRHGLVAGSSRSRADQPGSGWQLCRLQIEGESCHFRNKYLPLFGSYCEKSSPLDHLT